MFKEYGKTPTTVLAETFGCTETTVRERAAKLGLSRVTEDPWAGASVSKWAPEVDDYLRELWDTGLTRTQMGEKLSKRFGAKITKNMVYSPEHNARFASVTSATTEAANYPKPTGPNAPG